MEHKMTVYLTISAGIAFEYKLAVVKVKKCWLLQLLKHIFNYFNHLYR